MAAPIYINVGDAAEGADLARSLGRHGLEAGLAWSDARWQVEVRSPRDAAVFRLRAFLVAVGWFEFSRRREQLAVLASAEAARLVRESAETACAGLLTRLGDYRGQSRFASGSRSSPSTKPRRPPGRSRQADVRPRPSATNPPATCAGRDKVRAIESSRDGKRAADD